MNYFALFGSLLVFGVFAFIMTLPVQTVNFWAGIFTLGCVSLAVAFIIYNFLAGDIDV